MSKNISKLSGRIGLKDNLFQKLSERSLNSKNGEGMKEIADKYHVGVSTLHGAESFYEFLRPAHREKKAFVCIPVKTCRPVATLHTAALPVPLTSLQPQQSLFRRHCLDFMVAAKAMTVERQTLLYKIQFCVDQQQICQPQITVSVKFSFYLDVSFWMF